MKPLTPAQTTVLSTIIEFTNANAYPPTIFELCEILGIGTRNGVVHHLDALGRKGYLWRGVGGSRQMRVLRDDQGYPLTFGYSRSY